MKLLSLLFVALVVGALSMSAFKSMNADRSTPNAGADAPKVDLRKPAAGVPMEAFGAEAAEAAVKARMERAE